MPKTTQERLSEPGYMRRSALTEEQVFRLWRAAIKDDDRLVDQVIQKVHDDMISFDRDRAEDVMELIVRRDRTASDAFRDFLGQITTFSGPNLLPLHASSSRRLDS
jgi:hypothetical protein